MSRQSIPQGQQRKIERLLRNADARSLLEHEWYHDFSSLGFPTKQRTGVFAQNQAQREAVLVPMLERVISQYKPKRGVELFCADGFFSQLALRHGVPEMTGYDLGLPHASGDPTFLKQSRLIAEILGTQDRWRLFWRDVRDLSENYELCICAGGLFHLPDPEGLLRLMHEYIDGPLVIQTVYSLTDTSAKYFEAPTQNRRYGSRFSLDWLLKAVDTAGWEVREKKLNELAANPPNDRGSVYLVCLRK